MTKAESEGYTIGTRFIYHPGRFQTWLGVAVGSATDYLYEDGYLTGQASSYSLVRYDLGIQGNLYHSESLKLGLFARAKHLDIGSHMIKNNQDLVLAYGLNLTFQIKPRRQWQHRYDYHHHINIQPSSRFLYYVARGAAEIFPRILMAIIKN
ncbi:hypothetical protein [Pseudobacteriovorax antillogorgiicola]|uniref:Uncharacterized protein n=1 Tax=Pseudobacteriovorax antillogorgiicola TaxID=1513793 RepID=A0A1Y6BLM4_9BACT|nr:hypothetical protein [Pseudobacteriovorax antillogorgiicola]TCS54579.1 hypothetical protein EDD56_10692 [Pseudobacteriovorax antillogorgiicola]SMF17956.1 hypothetical protein SAMN06296036_106151 [Pseudobacteriovorax antillogorgiicola]